MVESNASDLVAAADQAVSVARKFGFSQEMITAIALVGGGIVVILLVQQWLSKRKNGNGHKTEASPVAITAVYDDSGLRDLLSQGFTGLGQQVERLSDQLVAHIEHDERIEAKNVENDTRQWGQITDARERLVVVETTVKMRKAARA